VHPTLDRRGILFGGAALALTQAVARAEKPPAFAQDVANLGAPDTVLEAKIAGLANEAGLAHVGFAAVDVVKGRTAFVRGGELFKTQGVDKLPIAVAFLRMVQQGDLRLEAKLRLTAADIAPGRSPLSDRLRKSATVFTAHQLLDHMLLNGDNTASDALLKLAGGPKKVQETLKSFDIEGLRVDRFERELQPQAVGLEPNPAYADAAAFDAAFAALGEAKQNEALERYLRDPRDTASPRAVATLLVKLLSGHLVQPRFAMMIFDLMRRTKAGDDRLKGGLTEGWTFAHRSGQSRTIQGTTATFNDAGLATHKNGAKVVVVLFIEGATFSPVQLAQFHRATARSVLQAWG